MKTNANFSIWSSKKLGRQQAVALADIWIYLVLLRAQRNDANFIRVLRKIAPTRRGWMDPDICPFCGTEDFKHAQECPLGGLLHDDDELAFV